MIKVEDISKIYEVPDKSNTGWKSYFKRKWIEKVAVKNISFSIKQGAFVGYIGPNGAGKSTTIKLLTGILTPSSGNISVLGFTPYKERYNYSYNIGVVFGQRRLLQYDIPVIDSLRLFRDIYEISEEEFQQRITLFTKSLNLDKYLHIPVRKLSLGERMRCEIAGALLHKPKIVFLDEPTIGLDAVAKLEIRKFLKEINEKEKTTIILTTHDMDDIEQLCERVLVIDNGSKIYDGSIKDLHKEYVMSQVVDVECEGTVPQFAGVKQSVRPDGMTRLTIDVSKTTVADVVKKLFSATTVHDISIKEQRLEDTIREIYNR